jgi:preprotein translocase subunit SecA
MRGMPRGEKRMGKLRLQQKISYALSTARGVPIEYDLTSYEKTVREIRSIDLSAKSDSELTGMACALRASIGAGMALDDALAEVYALAAEASSRALGLRPFDAQLVAGIVMHRGKLAQVQTGEGKTLAAVFPACLNAMAGAGVHVMTANDYLARRDVRWMRPVYVSMGLSVASVQSCMGREERAAAYRADVTYLTAREAGFDYLRDGLCLRQEELVQRGHAMALVDEADFILIDEARIPLVIAGAAGAGAAEAQRADEVARGLRPGIDYEADREGRRVSILLPGHRRIEEELGITGIHEEPGASWFARIHAALHARVLLRRDVDYVVREGAIQPVDELTGRIADRRQWPWGIQAALEARERLTVRPEGRVFGSITTQSFIALYGKVAAMTATAVPSAEELAELYGCAAVIVPPVLPPRRVDEPDVVTGTREEKNRAVTREILRAHAAGRPVLVGTASVRESQELADALRPFGIPCEVLNAKNDEREAEVISRAGRMGAVTISTNMAGRGTDIRIGDDPAVLALGGLFVIGTNRHDSRRVDDQLRGRAGRQGEPGSSRFFISLEDPLFERYGVREFLPRDCPLSDPRVLREIDRAQSIIEARNHSIRRTLRKYSLLVELDRRRLRALRDAALCEGKLPPDLEAACPGPHARPRLIEAFLSLLDSFWSDHLQLVEEVQEGIGLERFAGRDPGLEYIHRVGGAFDSGWEAVWEKLIDACRHFPQDAAALEVESLGVSRPSSTWTYQVDDLLPVRFNIGGPTAGVASFVAGPVMALGGLFGVLAGVIRRVREHGAPRARRR